MRERLYARRRKKSLRLAPLAWLHVPGAGSGTTRNISAKHLLAGLGILCAVVLAGVFAASLWPRTATFSYTGSNCITHPVLLPDLISKNQSATYAAKPKPSVSIAGYPLYAHTVCITPTQAPAEHAEETIQFGTPLLMKRIQVATAELPSLSNENAAQAAIPARDPLLLKLDTTDEVFDYQLRANGNAAECVKQGRSLQCDVNALQLRQDETYDVALHRIFDGAATHTVFERPLTAVEGLDIAGTSITPNQIVHTAPKQITITFTQAVAALEGAYMQRVDGDHRKAIPITTEIHGRNATIHFAEPLARRAAFLFTAENARAVSGDTLTSPLSLTFETSGGPHVRNANISNTRVSPTTDIVLTFDTPISPSQHITDLVQLEADGTEVNAQVHADGNTLTISPENNLPRCAPLTLNILDGLKNEHGIPSNTVWQRHARTLCQEVTKIGESVQGRAINAHRFGNGPHVVVFVGGMHGDERSSVHTLNHWMSQLEANPERIPEDRTIVVIPNSSPDGFAADIRNNANDVDLNRNFPTHDWQSGVTTSDGEHLPAGGGTEPLSEPESQVLADYVLGLKPDLVLTYHSIAGYVIPNSSGDSDELARAYAQKSDLEYASHDQTDEIFPYDTSGAFEDWLHDKHDIPALLIELWTQTDNEFPANQDAMWRMIELP